MITAYIFQDIHSISARVSVFVALKIKFDRIDHSSPQILASSQEQMATNCSNKEREQERFCFVTLNVIEDHTAPLTLFDVLSLYLEKYTLLILNWC